MDLLEAIEARHAIRAYTDEPVAADTLTALESDIARWNEESGLHMQIGAGLDDAFCGLKTHYGRFQGVHNAIALICPAAGSVANGEAALSPEEAALQERVGYYGEMAALRAVQLELQTSWAVLDGAAAAANPWWTLTEGETAVWMIAFGHGARAAGRRRTKPMETLASVPGDDFSQAPDWFTAGMEAAMAAPTSLSQQPFHFTLNDDGTVSAEALDGLFAHVGLGTAKCHFEIGAAPHHVEWR
ncbi:nitroreductase family protein [Bifidobacterium olomucense]|uniref:Putative TM nitroreductase n=1 Tax=Bifidobacterium olomucense TaxID=2675324 RepID=A0A7Y0HY15_9BIFI|nr:nitroreductase family protein [Bifidobacterium sp. DSM 109959]NMM98629.1 putative TM nitroreductase [Bifidobacterium sp. DSM 109959]